MTLFIFTDSGNQIHRTGSEYYMYVHQNSYNNSNNISLHDFLNHCFITVHVLHTVHHAETTGPLDWNSLGTIMTKYLEDDVNNCCIYLSLFVLSLHVGLQATVLIFIGQQSLKS